MTSIHRKLIRAQMRRDGELWMWNQPFEVEIAPQYMRALPPDARTEQAGCTEGAGDRTSKDSR